MLQQLLQRLATALARANPVEPLTVAELNRLVGLCEGILADGEIQRTEAIFLLEWMHAKPEYQQDRRTAGIYSLLESSLSDNRLANTEREELFVAFSEFCDSVIDLDGPKLTRLKQSVAPKGSRKGKGARSDELTLNLNLPKTKRPASQKRKPQKKASASVSLAVGDELMITYENSTGETNDRTVIYKGSSRKSGYTYLNAVCTMRNAYRTFRADRILMAIHLESGEYIADPESAFS